MPSDYHKNTFYVSDIDEKFERDMIIPLTMEVQRQIRKGQDGLIDIWINSCGGYLSTAWAFIAQLELAMSYGVTVRSFVTGDAFSAGSMIAITASERYISSVGEHLIHFGTVSTVETTQTQIDRNNKWKRRSNQNMMDHYKHYAGVPDLDKYLRDDFGYIPAKKCIKYGLADKLLSEVEL